MGATTLIAVTALQSDSPLMAHAAFSDAAAYGGQHFAADRLQPPTALSAAVRCVIADSAPTVVGSATASGTGVVKIAMPSQVLAGDLLIVVGTNVPTGPYGWSASTGVVWPRQLNAHFWQRVATTADAGRLYTWGGVRSQRRGRCARCTGVRWTVDRRRRGRQHE